MIPHSEKTDTKPPHLRTASLECSKFRNPHLKLEVDLGVIRRNVELLAEIVDVALLPVVKADAYGLGIEAICDTIEDLVAGFCVFQAREAIVAHLAQRTGKRVLALGPPEGLDPDDYLLNRISPTVVNPLEAQRLRKASPALCVDTGMQRFACRPEDVRRALIAGGCREVFTHATELHHVEKLKDLTDGHHLIRHAAASSLLHDKRARLDAVRPGLALSQNAVNISTRIVEVHESRGPAGYSGFVTARHGVILVGYSHGLRRGPCLINGRRTRILETGMQSAFVEIEAGDCVGDDVILLSHDLTETDLSASWNCSPHEVLTSLTSAGTRYYRY